MHIRNITKIIIIIFIVEILAFWAVWFMYGNFWKNGNDYIADMLNNINFVMIIIIIITAILAFFFILREIYYKDKIIFIGLFIVFLIAHLILYLNFSDMGRYVTGSYQLKEKENEEGAYYLMLENIDDTIPNKIKCEKNIYDKIDIDEKNTYELTIRWLSFSDEEGVLYEIVIE